MTNIAIFASGNGSNAERIISHLADEPRATVALILADNPQAAVLARAHRLNVPAYLVRRAHLNAPTTLDTLRSHGVSLIVLAGFLGLVPPELIQAYPNRIINIHPALLPKFGGKGMYGLHVHQAVLQAGESTSGITIHYVNARYDEGSIILQAQCPVFPSDTPDSLAARVHQLEYDHYPNVVQRLACDEAF